MAVWLIALPVLVAGCEIRLAGDSDPATVTVAWTTTVAGVRCPSGATCTTPEPSSTSPSLPGSAAVVQAAQTHRTEVGTAVQLSRPAHHWFGDRITRRRIRSLRQHWIPRLTEALAQVGFELAEQERAESHRWAAELATQ